MKEALQLKDKKLLIGICAGVLFLIVEYVVGFVAQFKINRIAWEEAGGLGSGVPMPMPSFSIFKCYKAAFTGAGFGVFVIFVLLIAGVIVAYKLYKKIYGVEEDERGFKLSRDGTYGTAKWMSDKEMKNVFEVTDVDSCNGIILGEKNGKVVAIAKESRDFNRHMMIFGASGTRKSRCIIRNQLFQSIKNKESAIITDPAGELYEDTAMMFRENGYEVKVLNFIDPTHSDCWNCMSDLNGDDLVAAVLTNVIIGNTSSGKGDHFWDNGEANLLKSLILLVDSSADSDEKNLSKVYDYVTGMKNVHDLDNVFNGLPPGHPARAPYNLFAQASDTVKQGIILGLGTRLQILQNASVKNLISNNDIDLTAPGRKPCAYFLITSSQDSTMAFLSSLFFSIFFIRIVNFASKQPGQACPVPINLMLDEFNNIGRIGGAADGSDFTRTLSVVRKNNLRIMMAVQSLGQLKNRYDNNLWSEIIGNCDIQLMLGCNDDETAEYISQRSGEMSIQVDSTRVTKKTLALFQFHPTYQNNEGVGKRMLLTPDEVFRLDKDDLLVLVRSNYMLKLHKFDFTQHPMSKQIKKVNVFDYNKGNVGYEDAYMRAINGGAYQSDTEESIIEHEDEVANEFRGTFTTPTIESEAPDTVIPVDEDGVVDESRLGDFDTIDYAPSFPFDDPTDEIDNSSDSIIGSEGEDTDKSDEEPLEEKPKKTYVKSSPETKAPPNLNMFTPPRKNRGPKPVPGGERKTKSGVRYTSASDED